MENQMPYDATNADTSHRVAAGELRQFVEQVERLEAEKRDAQDAIKEKYAEIKARGYLVTAVKTIVRERRMDADDLAERDAVLEMYREVLGG